MTDVEHALRWAVAELRGETAYSNDEQRRACFYRADEALAKVIDASSVSPAGDFPKENGPIRLATTTGGETPLPTPSSGGE